jgi:peptidoglycan/LPS O-acetylase OafA/YrhL
MVLVAGIGIGIAFAFLNGQINQTFSTIQRLRSTFALPVLGGISAVLSPRERRRRVRELLTFSTVTTSLVIAYAGLLSIENLGAERLVNAARGLGVI